MPSNIPSLPPAIIRMILEHLEVRLLENIEDPNSLTYWPLGDRELIANSFDLGRVRRQIWEAFLPVLTVSSEFSRAFRSRRSHPVLILSDEEMEILPQSTDLAGPADYDFRGYKWVEIRLHDRSMILGAMDFFYNNSFSMESITIHVSRKVARHLPASFWRSLYSLPQLGTFIYRVNMCGSPIEPTRLFWIMAGAPNLRDLTVFQLGSPIQLLGGNSEQLSCQLRCLHIHGFLDCSYHTLHILFGSTCRSLEELTLVFDSPAETTEYFQPVNRGVSTASVIEIFSGCLSLRVLRVCDLVSDVGPDWSRIRPPIRGVYYFPSAPPQFDDDNIAQRTMVDQLVPSLSKLQVLEISGRLFSPALFDNLRLSGCRVSHLTIYRYPGFPWDDLMNNFRNGNLAFRHLRNLILGQTTLPDPELTFLALEELQIICLTSEVNFHTAEKF